MDRISTPIHQGTNLSSVESVEIDQLIAHADSLIGQRRELCRCSSIGGWHPCWCGAQVVNGHHCENGHMQQRAVRS